MKKILLFIILFFISFNYVNAETFYGEYRLVDDYSTYKDDLLKIENIKLYNTFKVNYIDMGYMLDNNEFIKDENDYKEEYISIDENEIGDEYIKVSSSENSTYMIQFKNFESSLKIYEVEIFYKDKKLPYGFIYGIDEKLFNITDNDYSTFIDSNEISNFYLNLYSRYNIKELNIKIYTNELDSKFLLSLGDISTFITLHKNKNKHIITFDSEDNSTIYEFKGFKNLYRYYKEEKEILNNYVDYGNNILLDDYIEFDIYYIRDKLILDDIMIINNQNQKIEDFIEYSSDKVNIECNIDYNVNGKYTCEYILNDISVKRDIIVNIPFIEDIKLKETNNNNYIKETTYKVKRIKKINDEPIKLDNDIELNLLKNNIDKQNKKDIVNIRKNKLLKYIKYVTIFILFIIEIILFIKKKKK